MIDPFIAMITGLIICIPFTIFAVGVFWYRPRLWLHSLPKDIQNMAKPKTSKEKKQTKLLLVPYLIILPGLSTTSAFIVSDIFQINFDFFGALLYLYIIWTTVHLWDFLIIDTPHTFIINPKSPPIPGTENAKGWKDYKFHFHAFLKATVMSAIFIIPLAIFVSLLT